MRLNKNFLNGSGHLTAEFCRRRKKLILACDMDETLLTESEKSHRIFMRPKIMYLLRNLRTTYELCLITYSTRDRAEQILKLKLDPDGKLFNGRVLCREDVSPIFTNKQEALYAHLPYPNCQGLTDDYERRPLAWQYIVMLDDDPGTWSHFPTCIPIRPFIISPTSSRTINGIRIPKTVAGEGGYVLSIQRFLSKLHASVFKQKPPLPIKSIGLDSESTNDLSNSKSEKKKKISKLSRKSLSVTPYIVIDNVKRRINSDNRFKSLCYSDPGHMLCVDPTQQTVTSESRFRSLFDNRISINLSEKDTLLT